MILARTLVLNLARALVPTLGRRGAAALAVWGVLVLSAGGTLADDRDFDDAYLWGAKADDPDYLSVGAGMFDVNDDEEAGEFRLEYRSDYRFLYFLKPFVGVSATTDRAVYGYFGVLADLYFGKRIVLTPSAAVGGYSDGDGKDLGSTIEFRTGGEIAWRFDDRSRLGVAFHHISNANLDDVNPGTEIVVLNYSLPFDSLFR